MKECKSYLRAGSDQGPAGVTKGQPFVTGTGGSENFRIPALITLQDGSIMAAVDARYSTTGDGGGLDTILSVSHDGGATWEYHFPLYFPDSEGYVGAAATTIIDPVLVQGSDGTIYLMADVNPTGVTSMGGYVFPSKGTGYITVDGKAHLALTDDYRNTNTTPQDADMDTYGYYVGDYDEAGFAAVISRKDGPDAPVLHVVDECGNLFAVEEDGSYTPLTQKQVNTDVTIQQNIFYADSVLHVYNTGYMWLATSRDCGKNWHHTILNAQIKRDDETAFLVSPGHGTVLGDGTVIIPFYTWDPSGAVSQQSTFIFSRDNGQTWTRTPDIGLSHGWSSESEVVELKSGTLRMFVRNNWGKICYADCVWDGDANNYRWCCREGITCTDIIATSSCNVSAIKYSEKIDGHDAILVACPGHGSKRAEGKIYVFFMEDDNSMNLAHVFPVTDGTYAYSCLTELKDGRVALLWEEGEQANIINFNIYEIGEIMAK